MTKSFEEFSLDQVRKNMADSGRVRPMVHVVLKTGQVLCFVFGDDKIKERRVIINVILAARVTGRLKYASFTGEAWFAMRMLPDAIPLPPAQDPDRKEGVFCLTWEGDKRAAHFFEIKRDGAKAELVPIMEHPDGLMTWIENAFLPLPFPAPEDLQVVAAEMLDTMFPPKA